MPPGIWVPVLWAFGYYSMNYSVRIAAPGGEYECLIAAYPFPYTSGRLPQLDLTFKVIGYGQMNLRSPVFTTYFVTPVSGG
jgi:hypothetical protein